MGRKPMADTDSSQGLHEFSPPCLFTERKDKEGRKMKTRMLRPNASVTFM
jgi:hypothetical protein